MARTFNGSTQYLERTDASGITGYPYTLSAWFYIGVNQDAHILGFADSATNNNYVRILYNSASTYVWFQRVTGTADNFSSNFSISTATWYQVVAVATSNISVEIFVNGVSRNTSSTDRAWATATRTSIGRLSRLSPANFMNGRVAEAAIWNAALTDDEAISLYTVSPSLIRPASLTAYWPLLEDDGDKDWWAGRTMTATASPTYSAHPPTIWRPSTKIAYAPTAAAPPAVGSPSNLLLLGVG